MLILTRVKLEWALHDPAVVKVSNIDKMLIFSSFWCALLSELGEESNQSSHSLMTSNWLFDLQKVHKIWEALEGKIAVPFILEFPKQEQ